MGISNGKSKCLIVFPSERLNCAPARGVVVVSATAGLVVEIRALAAAEVEVGRLVAEGLAELPVDGGAVVGVQLQPVELHRDSRVVLWDD